MCLYLTITLAKDDVISHDVLMNLNQSNSKVAFGLTKDFISKRSNVLYLAEVGQGCACSLLTDTAGWNPLYWDLRLEVMPDIARMLKLLRQNTKNGFSFQAHWIAEAPAEHIAVSMEEMAQVIERGEISSKAKYWIDYEIICSKCGLIPFSRNDKFCRNCGERLQKEGSRKASSE
jgi:hypothetical protein